MKILLALTLIISMGYSVAKADSCDDAWAAYKAYNTEVEQSPDFDITKRVTLVILAYDAAMCDQS